MHSLDRQVLQLSHISSLNSWQSDHGPIQIILICRCGQKGPWDFCIYRPSELPKAENEVSLNYRQISGEVLNSAVPYPRKKSLGSIMILSMLANAWTI